MTLLSADTLEQLHLQARQVAHSLRLPFRRRSWRGLQGNWQGLGSGSSLDFQDHRPYSPGDDPRYINWQAYARSEHYTMKLYRQEVSPALDLVVDLSASMFVDEQKSARVAELVYWAVECSLQSGAALRCYGWSGKGIEPLRVDEVLAHRWLREKSEALDSQALSELPWRHGSMRVVISDLLWPGESQPLFHTITEGQAFGLIFAPFSAEEAQPSWAGNLEMVDCESRAVRVQRIDSGLLRRYRAAYERHFDLSHEQALRYHVPLVRVPANVDLTTSLQSQGSETGAVEWME